MNAAGQLFKSFLMGRLLILIPVYIGETPEKGLISEIFCHLQIVCTVFSLWRTVKRNHFLTGDLLVECGDAVQFLGKGCLCGNPGHIRVRPGMISDNMTLSCHAFDEIRLIGEKIADNKEGCGSLMLFECIQNCRCIAVFITAVKGQIKDVFLR